MNVNNDTHCANEKCGHKLGKHFTTFDGSKSGCSDVTTHVSGGNIKDYTTESRPCPCKQFVVAYKPSNNVPLFPHAGHTTGCRCPGPVADGRRNPGWLDR